MVSRRKGSMWTLLTLDEESYGGSYWTVVTHDTDKGVLRAHAKRIEASHPGERYVWKIVKMRKARRATFGR